MKATLQIAMYSLVITALMVTDLQAVPQNRIYVNHTSQTFEINGKRIWINGVNTPWDNWNDFGGNFDPAFWDEHFALLRKHGVNSSRVWISCNSDNAVQINASGLVTGSKVKHWEDVDTLMQIAEKHQIYIKATLLSFDHFNGVNSFSPTIGHFQKMLLNRSNVDAFVDHYVTPFAKRYANNPYLFSIDLINEPENIAEGRIGGVGFEHFQYYFAKAASAIHKHSDILVTVGAVIKHYSPVYEGNVYNDQSLQQAFADPDAYLDFYSLHYYEWTNRWFGNPFDISPTEYQMHDKPVMIGETAARGVFASPEDYNNNKLLYSSTEGYERAFTNGYQGVMAWTSNPIGHYGNLSTGLGDATQAFFINHCHLVRPESMDENCDISKLPDAPPPAEEPGNVPEATGEGGGILQNGMFSGTINPWGLETESGSVIVLANSEAGNQDVATIALDGSGKHADLAQDGIALQSGKHYRLTLDIKGLNISVVTLHMHDNISDRPSLGLHNKSIPVTPFWQPHEIHFTANNTTDNAIFFIRMNNMAPSQLYIDNLELSEVGKVPEEPAANVPVENEEEAVQEQVESEVETEEGNELMETVEEEQITASQASVSTNQEVDEAPVNSILETAGNPSQMDAEQSVTPIRDRINHLRERQRNWKLCKANCYTLHGREKVSCIRTCLNKR